MPNYLKKHISIAAVFYIICTYIDFETYNGRDCSSVALSHFWDIRATIAMRKSFVYRKSVDIRKYAYRKSVDICKYASFKKRWVNGHSAFFTGSQAEVGTRFLKLVNQMNLSSELVKLCLIMSDNSHLICYAIIQSSLRMVQKVIYSL